MNVVSGRSASRGSRRIRSARTEGSFAERELGVAIEGLRIQREALNPGLASQLDGEGAAMAEASIDSISAKLAALEFARGVVKGEIDEKGVNRFIEGATYSSRLGRETVSRVRGERQS